MVRLCRKPSLFLYREKLKMYEMSFSRPKYLSFVFGQYPQIAQNWCLCKYCQKYRPELQETYLHWRSELETSLDNLNGRDTDPKKNKYNWTHQALFDIADLDDPSKVFKSCRLKFFHENEEKEGKPSLGITEEQQKEMCALFSQSLEDIVKCISSEDMVTTYTRKEFPDKLEKI